MTVALISDRNRAIAAQRIRMTQPIYV